MIVHIIGGGWFGCHIAASFLKESVQVKLYESGTGLFNGASGANPARLHIGPHYPRSTTTRHASQMHYHQFMNTYGKYTRPVPINLYAIASDQSLVDFQTYTKVLKDEIEFIKVHNPVEFGLHNVEGAILTGERHIVIDDVRRHFEDLLAARTVFGSDEPPPASSSNWIIDCTFCANDEKNVDRFEPCVTVLMEGPTNKAVTIMDGPFPSLYPWNEARGLNSLTSASLTPIRKDCKTYDEAKAVCNWQTKELLYERAEEMVSQMSKYFPAIRTDYKIADFRMGVRAMPLSSSDARLVDVVEIKHHHLRIRSGKIDSIFKAYDIVSERVFESFPRFIPLTGSSHAVS